MKLVGYIDGIEVGFDFYPPNKWKGTIPKKITGKYILQLKVIDEAGNESNFSDLFICIDFKNMKFKILGYQYNFRTCNDFLCVKLNDLSSDQIIRNSYAYNELDHKFTYKLVIR